ncbi:MAG: hypothetical protein PHU21_11555 [Elusimicrobia bacterium]|nr:hypothetical protein [Elusimicrobiota bacterium]
MSEQAQPGRPAAPPEHSPGPVCGKVLSHNSIVLPLRSATLKDAVDELVPKALHGAGDIVRSSAKIAESLKKGLSLRSVEYHRGLAFLHHRLKEAPAARMALGIAPDGLEADGAPGGRVFVVALFLKPTREPGYDIPPWARKTMCSERMVYRLRTAADVGAALQALAEP